MSTVNAISELHHLGEYVTGQNEGRKDQPITGNDLYNFAIQTDSNFMTVRGDIRNMGTVMNSEFKGVEARFNGVEARFNGVDNEFKLVRMEVASESKLLRMEMASGFAAVDARFEIVDARFKGVDARFNGVDARFEIVDAEFKAVRAEMREGFAKLPITVTVWVCSTMIAILGVVATVVTIVISQIR